MPTDNTEMPLSGNPFVDTGLAVIATLAGLHDVRDLKISHARAVHGDGERLARWNAALKCFRMVFTTNSILTNPSIEQKKRRPAYVAVINRLLDTIGADDLNYRCQACGSPRSVNLDALCRNAIPADVLNLQKRAIGRDWFPLAGSLGSDAQALPSASESARLCARCLFAVQYLPMGLRLLDGRLAVFESTSNLFWQIIARTTAEEVLRRVSAGNYETIGKKEGTNTFVLTLLDIFERLQHAILLKEIPEGASLRIWRFSNSGASAECSTEEIPNAALRFLWEAVRSGNRKEISEILSSAGKREPSFLRCIAEGIDYPGLYPRGHSRGVSPELFCLYQANVSQRSSTAIETAARLGQAFAVDAREPELKRATRDGAFDRPSLRSAFKLQMIRLAERGELSLHEYQSLFPTTVENGTRVSSDGWEVIRYFLNQPSYLLNARRSAPSTDLTSQAASLEYYAFQIFRGYVARRGIESFQRNVLNRFRRGRIPLRWLQDQFVKLAAIADGFSFANWLFIFGDPPAIAEPMFQMRLLWIERIGSRRSDEWDRPPCPEINFASGLGKPLEDRLRTSFKRFVKDRGLHRFQRDMLLPLSQRAIGLDSLKDWIKKWSADEVDEYGFTSWKNHFPDYGDNIAISEFFFRIHLLLANLYRVEQVGSQLE
jgi:hypothetical protein